MTYTKGVVSTITLHNVVTATATSAVCEVLGAESIGIYLTAASIASRSGLLTITISPDGMNFYAYNMLITNSINAISEGLTRVANITRAANGTDILWLSPETLGGITHIKATITITDGEGAAGTFTVKLVVKT